MKRKPRTASESPVGAHVGPELWPFTPQWIIKLARRGDVAWLARALRDPEVQIGPIVRTFLADLLEGREKIPRIGAWTRTKVDSVAKWEIRAHMRVWDSRHPNKPAARRREIQALASAYACSESMIYDALPRRANYSGK